MQNNIFKSMVFDTIEKWNPDVMGVLSTKMVPGVLPYLDKIISSAMLSLNKGIDLRYEGYKALTPDEEYNVVAAGGKKRMNFDFGRSDVAMIKLMFSFDGEPIPPRNLYIPFVDENGIMHISDTKYQCIPVLSDTIVSPTSKDIFTRLLRDKVTFKRESRNIMFNGRVLNSELIYKDLYRTNNRVITDNLGKIVTSSPLYLFARFGFIDTFLTYAETKPIIKVGDYNKNDYLEYDEYTTKGEKPWSLKNDNYKPHNVKVLVKKDCSTDYLIQTFVTGFIYTLDVFPEYANEIVDIIESDNVADETEYWRILMGRIIFKNSYSTERGLADVNNHFNSLESYIDPIVKEKLQENELYINTFFDLIAYICKVFKDMTTNYKIISADVRNRYVDILYYILYDIFEALIRSLFELNKKKDRKITITKDVVTKVFDLKFSSRKIFTLNSKGSLNIALMPAENVGDNKMKLAQNCELQENGKGVNRAPRVKHGGANTHATATGAVLGSIYGIAKSTLDERMKINPFVKLSRTGRIQLDARKVEYVKIMDGLLNGNNLFSAKDINQMFTAAAEEEKIEFKDI